MTVNWWVMPPNWIRAQKKAAITAKWAVTMTKVRIRKTIAKTKWQLVVFVGSKKGESGGIIDMLAIRKDHRMPAGDLKRGDLFQVVLIQVKGGGATFPTLDDIARLRSVSRRYKAKAVLLSHWKKGAQAEFYRLKKIPMEGSMPSDHWDHVTEPRTIFR